MKTRLDDVPIDFFTWRFRLRLSMSGAAELLGISRTTIAKYENGAQVPRVVRLAMVGAEMEMKT